MVRSICLGFLFMSVWWRYAVESMALEVSWHEGMLWLCLVGRSSLPYRIAFLLVLIKSVKVVAYHSHDYIANQLTLNSTIGKLSRDGFDLIWGSLRTVKQCWDCSNVLWSNAMSRGQECTVSVKYQRHYLPSLNLIFFCETNIILQDLLNFIV